MASFKSVRDLLLIGFDEGLLDEEEFLLLQDIPLMSCDGIGNQVFDQVIPQSVMQLIFVVNKIYQALEKGNEVRAVFLDISKAFDKVWHKGLLTKLKSIGINGPLLQWFENYLTERYQRVTIEGMSSDWARIEAGVPQGSVVGPLLFLIYINNIADNVSSTCFLFADDSLLLDEVILQIDTANKLNNDLDSISMWADRWLVTMSEC
ncbi:Hypothetical predicted protein [Paramuricea clavata]|uniref:Uncharacterized protein n=1 Tax=Paramuricea clavata TaxID=317549 RepID=A0A6S7HHI5_PARCT|nr:Hypothetical predicted protein [Paramuricea clavata]